MFKFLFDIAIAFYLFGFCGLAIYKNNIIFILIFFELIVLGEIFSMFVVSIYLDDLFAQFAALCFLLIGVIDLSYGIILFLVYLKLFGKHRLSNSLLDKLSRF